MYLRQLDVRRLRLIKNLSLSFDQPAHPDGYAPWTVIIGPNGTAKTTLLHAIALAAAGPFDVNTLAGDLRTRLRDRRAPDDEPLSIEAQFSFSKLAIDRGRDTFPHLEGEPGPDLRLRSCVTLDAGSNALSTRSSYLCRGQVLGKDSEDPLGAARSLDPPLPFWFVGGYGVARNLPAVGATPSTEVPALARLGSLFTQRPLAGLSWIDRFQNTQRGGDFAKAVKEALFQAGPQHPLLPGLTGLELRGANGDWRLQKLQESERFVQRVGNAEQKVPAVSLSHGYQSTIAWVSDLVGQILDEAGTRPAAHDFVGTVLVDEIDLYLHPSWQATVIQSLREIFPRLQFIVTTHSPIVLFALRPGLDQVVRLENDPITGDVTRVPVDVDPRLLTSSQVLRRYFGLDEIVPPEVRALLAEYQSIATDPHRTDEEDERLKALDAILILKKIEPGVAVVARA